METERRTEISQTNISYFQLPSVRKTIYLTPLGVNAKDLFSTLDRVLNAGPGKTQEELKTLTSDHCALRGTPP